MNYEVLSLKNDSRYLSFIQIRQDLSRTKYRIRKMLWFWHFSLVNSVSFQTRTEDVFWSMNFSLNIFVSNLVPQSEISCNKFCFIERNTNVLGIK